MNASKPMELRTIGYVESPLTDVEDAPHQADEGAPSAVLVIEDVAAPALAGLGVDDPIVVITWLDRADRGVLAVHPRGETQRPLTGVFATRSPHRPNPIGLHDTTVADITGIRITVDHLEAVDGTPIIDIKPRLGPEDAR